MLFWITFSSIGDGNNTVETDETNADSAHTSRVEGEELVYTIVFGSLGGTFPILLRQTFSSSSFDWKDLVAGVLSIVFGLVLGLKIGLRLFGNENIKLSFRSLVYGLLTLSLSCLPYLVYIVVKSVWLQ
jgi:hypothetical protein